MFFFVYKNKLSKTEFFLGVLCYFFHILTYLYTALINPGIPNKIRHYQNTFSTVGIKKFKVCKKCCVIMNLDKKTSHCKICGICVEGFN